jgi:hypothetical protein
VVASSALESACSGVMSAPTLWASPGFFSMQVP